MLDLLHCLEIAFLLLAIRVTDHSRGSADKQNCLVAVVYKVAHHHGHRKITYLHTIGTGVNSPVKCYGVAIESRNVFKGGLVDETAPGQFFGECHMAISITYRKEWGKAA